MYSRRQTEQLRYSSKRNKLGFPNIFVRNQGAPPSTISSLRILSKGLAELQCCLSMIPTRSRCNTECGCGVLGVLATCGEIKHGVEGSQKHLRRRRQRTFKIIEHETVSMLLEYARCGKFGWSHDENTPLCREYRMCILT